MPRKHQRQATLPRGHNTKGEAVSVVTDVKGGVRKASDKEEALDCRRAEVVSFRQLVAGVPGFLKTELGKHKSNIKGNLSPRMSKKMVL